MRAMPNGTIEYSVKDVMKEIVSGTN